jgi:hypothetical protein
MPSPYAAAATVCCCSFITASWKQNSVQARRLGITTTTDLDPSSFFLSACFLLLLFFDFVMFEYWEDDGRPEAKPARRLFFFTFLLHTRLAACFGSCSERRVTISKGKKETKKEKTTLIELCSVVELHLISMWIFAFDVF